MTKIRVLALDHFFDQDLCALEAHPRLDVRRFPYQRLRGRALRIMGSEVGRGLHTHNRTDLAAARGRYAAWLTREVRSLYLERAFDVVVLPSDTFFYVRTLPAATHRLGIPVAVVQKETTISSATMETFSTEVRTEAPFVSDLMTVCSERQREFWIRAGTPGDRIVITGQPRFDIYASAHATAPSSRRRVLFLTYALDAYVPGAGRGKGLRTWESLRDATERTLVALARDGACDIVIKCHPQQDHQTESRRLEQIAGPTWNGAVRLAAADTDTRELIMDSDFVVGFQTTALYEAVAACRRVIYAAWGAQYEELRAGLIRFDEAPKECVAHAHSPEMLTAMLSGAMAPPPGVCSAWYEQALGTVDGHATERVVDQLATLASSWSATEEVRRLERHRRSFAVALLARSLAAEVVWAAAMPVAHLAGERRRVATRGRRAREARVMATKALRGNGGNDDV